MSKHIVAIWAEDENGLIGHQNKMPWHLPKELQHFKETTMGHILVMGRVTFDGLKRRTLPGRETWILSRKENQADEEKENLSFFSSVEAILDRYREEDKTLFIAGGSRVYETFLPYCDEVIKTTIHGVFEGDTYFPKTLLLEDFELVSETTYPKASDNPYAFTVTRLRRKTV